MAYRIFSGVFDNFSSAPESDDIYSSDLYLNNLNKKLKNSSYKFNEGYVINLIIRLAMGDQEGTLRVLDYGGGIGETFISLPTQIKESQHIEFAILDNKTMCNHGREINKKEYNIFFIEELSEYNTEKQVDLIHLGSVIQYLSDWRKTLLDLMTLKPKLIVLDDVFCGNIKSFTTMQKYYTSQVRFNFINIEEIKDFFINNSYELLFSSPFIPVINGKTEFYDMSNFEQELQIPHAMNMAFVKA
jgi:putative methyltransferase (TIGR04325 family)